jgi:hypothetical protein
MFYYLARCPEGERARRSFLELNQNMRKEAQRSAEKAKDLP